uniref:N-alpha-acetyltransferase 40 n=1 Tax=Astatotilapia calliptera TaxID=8154 RepID=A0AAX7TED9_ASTCA
MNDERAWYLLARDADSSPVAFSHFRFDIECGEEVLYCYEVQLESRVRRKGLGKFLIQILQLIANSTQMKKVMLTVFKQNKGAYQFFREALQEDVYICWIHYCNSTPMTDNNGNNNEKPATSTWS